MLPILNRVNTGKGELPGSPAGDFNIPVVRGAGDREKSTSFTPEDDLPGLEV
jgi:hypothetical protein